MSRFKKAGTINPFTPADGTFKARGGRSPYKRGYAFEAKVRDWLKERGYHVLRQHNSAFPDLLVISPVWPAWIPTLPTRLPVFIECKVGKKLRPDEIDRFGPYKSYGKCYLAHPEVSANGLHYIVFKDAFTGEEVCRL